MDDTQRKLQAMAGTRLKRPAANYHLLLEGHGVLESFATLKEAVRNARGRSARSSGVFLVENASGDILFEAG